MTTEAIISAALELPPESRANLVEVLLHSMEPESAPHLSAEWIAEIEDRIAALRRGELETVSREEVMRTAGRDRGV